MNLIKRDYVIVTIQAALGKKLWLNAQSAITRLWNTFFLMLGMLQLSYEFLKHAAENGINKKQGDFLAVKFHFSFNAIFQ